MNSPQFNVDPRYAALVRELNLDSERVFTDPRIRVWRSLPDRENATLDCTRHDGSPIRLHIKRYPAAFPAMAKNEIDGFNLLNQANIPAATIIAHGARSDGSSFILLEDLAGYSPADKLLEQGFGFDRILHLTAALAARLHGSQLHHRDLYLCHFMIKSDENSVDARLIDMTRVSRLNSPLTRRRWIIKDLAQFWYSTLSVGVNDAQRNAWLEEYCRCRNIRVGLLAASIRRKAAAIARHDVKLKASQPGRNVSINSVSP